jgi:hypothetical protein
MRVTDEQIEKRLRARGVDVQSDEGARTLQAEIERNIARQSARVGGLLFKASAMQKTACVRGIRI